MKCPNEKKEKVEITKKEYDYLLERDMWLGCLEAVGVDNWEGYDIACEEREEREAIE